MYLKTVSALQTRFQVHAASGPNVCSFSHGSVSSLVEHLVEHSTTLELRSVPCLRLALLFLKSDSFQDRMDLHQMLFVLKLRPNFRSSFEPDRMYLKTVSVFLTRFQVHAASGPNVCSFSHGSVSCLVEHLVEHSTTLEPRSVPCLVCF